MAALFSSTCVTAKAWSRSYAIPIMQSLSKVPEKIRNEFVLKVTGMVRHRPPGTVNPNLVSGEIEVLVQSIEILNTSLPPPFLMDDEHLSEAVRLEHRYLDLRRPEMQANLRLRYKVAMAVRTFLDQHGFIDVETPMLTKSTPEGARDYLVPSRVNTGHFFALPQSPQLFKQLLMVAGFDRYYQITKCFRDEDLRADRQPEFTQIDIETSFLNETQIMEMMEEMICGVFKSAINVDLPSPFPRLTHARSNVALRLGQAGLARSAGFDRAYRCDEGCRIQGLPRSGARPGGRVAALRVPGGGSIVT